MPRFKADWRAIGDLPTRRPTLAASDIRRCIQPEPGDDCERVAAARIYGDPFPVAALTEAAKLRRTQGALDQSSAAERERDCSGAIIPMIGKRTMTAAEAVRLGPQLIRGPDRALDCERRVRWRAGETAAKTGFGSRNRRPGKRKAVRESGRSYEDKNRCAKKFLTSHGVHQQFLSRCHAKKLS